MIYFWNYSFAVTFFIRLKATCGNEWFNRSELHRKLPKALATLAQLRPLARRNARNTSPRPLAPWHQDEHVGLLGLDPTFVLYRQRTSIADNSSSCSDWSVSHPRQHSSSHNSRLTFICVCRASIWHSIEIRRHQSWSSLLFRLTLRLLLERRSRHLPNFNTLYFDLQYPSTDDDKKHLRNCRFDVLLLSGTNKFRLKEDASYSAICLSVLSEVVRPIYLTYIYDWSLPIVGQGVFWVEGVRSAEFTKIFSMTEIRT